MVIFADLVDMPNFIEIFHAPPIMNTEIDDLQSLSSSMKKGVLKVRERWGLYSLKCFLYIRINSK